MKILVLKVTARFCTHSIQSESILQAFVDFESFYLIKIVLKNLSPCLIKILYLWLINCVKHFTAKQGHSNKGQCPFYSEVKGVDESFNVWLLKTRPKIKCLKQSYKTSICDIGILWPLSILVVRPSFQQLSCKNSLKKLICIL